MSQPDVVYPALPIVHWTRVEYDARRLAAFVQRYQRERGYPPTFSEMREHVRPGRQNTNGTYLRLQRAVKMGIMAAVEYDTEHGLRLRKWVATL